jgi:membrane associated rhomboid family serine protease
MIPLHDENPTNSTPIVTIGLIVANIAVFLIQLAINLEFSIGKFGLVPAHLLHGSAFAVLGRNDTGHVVGVQNIDPAWVTVFASMFMHGGWLHILFNMWFLWIFGNNVEDSMGSGKFLGFYLFSGIMAAAAQVVMAPNSQIPMIGASGAIGGVLGAYLVLFPGSRVVTLITTFIITTVDLPAWVVLGLWFVLQIVSGLAGMMGPESGGVAYAAHVGGFATGMILGRILARPTPPASRSGQWGNPAGYRDWR